ncbi:MAG: PTS sugar transporter subunit IIB [Clostridiales bacterium]|nr:PTS sugar transporter subunit IIB [Clostridiales bacterium]
MKRQVKIQAVPKPELSSYTENMNVILLGPQISYALEEIKTMVAGRIPVDVIDVMDYGTMNGAKVLAKAMDMMG